MRLWSLDDLPGNDGLLEGILLLLSPLLALSPSLLLVVIDMVGNGSCHGGGGHGWEW